MILLDIDTYTLFLHLHSGIRWIVLAMAVFIVIKSIISLSGGSYGKLDNILGASFVGLMDLMLLLGLILYFFLSPITKSAFNDFGAAMGNSAVRFWAVEHIFAMIVAVALAHIGRSKAKKAGDSKKKYKFQLIFFGLSLLAMIVAIPWERL